ncbi:MAG: hypothetical protein JSW65_01290 [Candidatus Bipolaricaulota bacterium]|nr:MAG: hypothetical protein JSW65_01290 [Candidatus Bipolaricaulota bacterium]
MTERTGRTVDLEAEKKAILALHEDARRAHFATDVEAALEGLADEQLILRGGTMEVVPVEALRESMTGYFAGATFHEWDDLAPPVIEISDDGTLAWMANRLKVRLTRVDESGDEAESAFVYSGILTYRKVDGKWIRTGNASTFAEP